MKKNVWSDVGAPRQIGWRMCGGGRLISIKNLTVFILVLCSCSVFAQANDPRAENMQNGLFNTFMSADRSYFKHNSASDNDPYGYGYWVTAHGLETMADAYQRTRNTVYRDRMKSIL